MGSSHRVSFITLFFLFFSTLFAETTYELVVLVSSRNLQYETGEQFFTSLAKQGVGSKLGHAWIVLCKKEENTIVEWQEGGHSGEFGIIAPRYFERLLQAAEDPTMKNPIQVLYEPLNDGLFEQGSGDNVPTYAAAFSLTKEGYEKLQALLTEGSPEYPFHQWSLTQQNCVHFILTCLGRIGIVVDAHVVMRVDPVTIICGKKVPMWTEDRYALLKVETPERLESELQKLVSLGLAREALTIYKEYIHDKPTR